MARFAEAIRSGRVLLMDGAMGTQLQRAPQTPWPGYEFRNFTHPDQVRTVHQAYVDAGAEILLTNTFQANPGALARHGQHHSLDLIWQAGLDIARQAAGPHRLIFADVGPYPFHSPADAVSWLTRLPLPEKADALLLETWSEPGGLDLARELARHWTNTGKELPLALSLAYKRHPDGRLTTDSGHTPEFFAERAARDGIAVLGVNCGRDVGLKEIKEILRRYRRSTPLPLLARANAGTPQVQVGQWIYPFSPQEMAAWVPELVEAGATLVGGCCGTTPEYIAAFRAVLSRRMDPDKTL